jgi:hypothetical protein
MKEIQTIQIWDNGLFKEGKVLDAYAVNVTLNQNATFYYAIFSEQRERLAYGNVFMNSEAYANWEQDDIAWDFVAKSLNLTIVGEYVPPAPPVVEEPIVEIPEENIPLNEENI